MSRINLYFHFIVMFFQKILYWTEVINNAILEQICFMEDLHMANEIMTAQENEIIIGEWQKTIASLEQEIARLRDENNKLEETVKWMHDLIWQLVREREDEKVEFEL